MAQALKCLPSVVREMTFRQVRGFFEYWEEWPPENETLAILAQSFTTWRPGGNRPITPEEHQRSLEQRWASGAMNAKQILESMGGGKKSVAVRVDGSIEAAAGIDSFPGVPSV